MIQKSLPETLLFMGIAAVLFAVASPLATHAQTCSCAGAPLLSSQDQASSSKGTWNVGLTFEHHDVSELYTGNQQLENRSFNRHTNSLLLEVNYGITERLMATGLLTSSHKSRKSGPDFRNRVTSRGLGEGLVMFKYTLHQNTIQEQYQLTLGGGTKIPVGPTDATGDVTALSPDMQPSTGSWDAIAWGHFSKTFLPTTTLNAFLTASYRYTGSHDFNNRPDYEFGNEFIAKAGISNNITTRLNYNLVTKYRRVERFKTMGQPIFSTGGEWINLIPGLNYKITEDITLRASGEFPLYRYVNGTQPTTLYSGKASVFYRF